MKIQIVQKRPFAFHDKALGMDVKGFMYAGLTELGPLEFSSMDPLLKPSIGLTFDPARAVEIPLRLKIWNGKIKYQHDLIQNKDSGDWEVNPDHAE